MSSDSCDESSVDASRPNENSQEKIDNTTSASPSRKRKRKRHAKKAGGLNRHALAKFNNPDGLAPISDSAFQQQKVEAFMLSNPINPNFIRREKARLPYSVFKPHSDEVYFLKSVYEGRPPTAFYPYPNYVKIERQSNRVRTYNRVDVEYLFMSFKISDTTHIYNAVVNSCKHAGFTMVEQPNIYFNL